MAPRWAPACGMCLFAAVYAYRTLQMRRRDAHEEENMIQCEECSLSHGPEVEDSVSSHKPKRTKKRRPRSPNGAAPSSGELRDLFQRFAIPGTNIITWEQFKKMCVHELDMKENTHDLRGLFKSIDVNNDGTIDPEEFVAGLRSHEENATTIKRKVQQVSDEKLLEKFNIFADECGSLSFDKFKAICEKELDLDLSAKSLRRVFDSIDSDSSGSIDCREFIKGVRQHTLLSNLTSGTVVNANFIVADDYDYEKNTLENYDSGNLEFYGQFKDIRSTRDYSYHTNVTKRRQLWQDHLIEAVVNRTEPQKNPWVVFTCGPMGAGKGYALSWMSDHGYFPLEHIVHIDPDYFKRKMPEWNNYVQRRAEDAGTCCHKESAFMQEIAQEVALRRKQNIWVDGSLRDYEWFAKVFADIRSRYKHYKIAIFYIFASEEKVRARIESRREVNGRTIPEKLIVESLQAPDRALAHLTPHSDFVLRIDNDGAVPKLAAFSAVDRRGIWKTVKQEFKIKKADFWD